MSPGSVIRPLVVAVACVAGGVLLRLPIDPFLGGGQLWLTFWPAVFVAGWFGGLRGGLIATALSLVVASLWLVPSSVVQPSQAVLGGSIFAACGIAFSYVSGAVRAARNEERRLREEAQAAHHVAHDANRTKDEFLAVLGHELRNPLSPIASAATLLRLRIPQSTELDVIDRQVKHMSRLVDDLLDISRITRGQLDLQRTVVDLAAVIEKASEMVSPQRARRGHRFILDVPRGIHVDVDAARLVQVITNVLVNAVKYSEPEQPIEIAARRDAERAVVTIADRGIGMDSAMLARAFEPFAQNPQDIDRAAGGLGLGLTIARRIVELHGGTMTASSAPGEGTTIEIVLPATDAVPISNELPAALASSGQLRILVVDDNQDAAQMLGSLLEARGHVVQIAYDGPSALELLRRFEPDLAFLDIGLPGMDGHELAAEMRKRGLLARLVAVTGYGQESDRKRALAAGFDEHLVKPVDLSRIDELIRELAA